mgnify:CR=1 FL=1
MMNKPALEFDISALNQNAIVNDIVYNPLQTELLKNARERGLQTVTGIGMLIHQAVPAFELWSGVKPLVDKGLEDLVLS